MTARIDNLTYNVTLCGEFYEICQKINVKERNPSFLSTGIFPACAGACMKNCGYLETRVCVGGKDVSKDVCTDLCDWRKDSWGGFLIFLIFLAISLPFLCAYIICKVKQIDNNTETSLTTYEPVRSGSAS
jgi:hypothetical protein